MMVTYADDNDDGDIMTYADENDDGNDDENGWSRSKKYIHPAVNVLNLLHSIHAKAVPRMLCSS